MTSVLLFAPQAVAGYINTGLFTIINLLVTYYVVNRFLIKPILKILRKRREDVAKELADADAKLNEATDKLSDAAMRLEKSTREATEIVGNARSQAEVQGEAILSEAKVEAGNMLTRADAEIGRMRVTMINGVRDEVADLSVAIATKVIGKVMDEHHQRDLVEQFLDKEMAAKNTAAPGPEAGISDQAASMPVVNQGTANIQSGVSTDA